MRAGELTKTAMRFARNAMESNVMPNQKIQHCAAENILHRAIQKYKPSHVVALFSGGHDSLCATHIASRSGRMSFVAHINTGIGVNETHRYVESVCQQFGWSLREYTPPESYESLVVDQGFPGPAHHWKMYHRLKERCLRQILRETKTNDRSHKIVFVSGRRRLESTRRMATMSDAIQTGVKNPSPRIVWVNPLIDWTSDDKDEYIQTHSLPRNEVVEVLCMSGECLCGAFAKPGELEWIRRFYPEAAMEIDRIAKLVDAAGKHAVWGERPRKPADKRQTELPLCWSCESKSLGT